MFHVIFQSPPSSASSTHHTSSQIFKSEREKLLEDACEDALRAGGIRI